MEKPLGLYKSMESLIHFVALCHCTRQSESQYICTTNQPTNRPTNQLNKQITNQLFS